MSEYEYRIRKLTPTECYSLMGMTKEDAEKARELGVSNSALYKQAGNGIVTNCVKLLFEHLYKSLYDDTFYCSDETENHTHDIALPESLTANILFSGIGCQERGINNSECFDLNVIHTSDIDKESIVSYAAIHCGLTQDMIDNYNDYPSKDKMAEELISANIGYDPVKDKHYDWHKTANKKSDEIKKYWLAMKLSNNLGDISLIDELEYADLWIYSFPCTSISVAGKQEGIIRGKTRSGLLYEVERLLDNAKVKDTLPKFLMLENVKNLVGKQFKPQFDEWCNYLDEVGYVTYWSVINAKDCGIPQNRERCFAISIRKDIDNGKFKFPEPFDNGLRLKDVLEDEVDEKFYITNDNATKLINELKENGTLEQLENVRQD